MGFVIAFLTGWVMLVCVIYPALMGQAHRKEKAAKMAMMGEFPQHAGEILRSMNEDDARVRGTVDKHFNDIGQVFSQAKQRTAKTSATQVKAVSTIARWLMK